MKQKLKNEEENLLFSYHQPDDPSQHTINSREKVLSEKRTGGSFNEIPEKQPLEEYLTTETLGRNIPRGFLKTSYFTNKESPFFDKIRKCFEFRYFDQEELLNLIEQALEKELIKQDQKILIWFLCFIVYVEKDEELFIDFLKEYSSELETLLKLSPKSPMNSINLGSIDDEIQKNYTLIITKLLEFFLENSGFLPVLSRTLRNMKISFMKIPQDVIKLIISKENHLLLNQLLVYRDRTDEKNSSLMKKESKRHKFFKLMNEMIVFQMQKENSNNKQEMIFSIMSHLLQTKYNKLLSFFLFFSRKLIKNVSLTIEALENSCSHYIKIAFKYYQKYPTIFLKEPVFFALMQALDRPQMFGDIVLFLFLTKKCIKDYNNLHIKLLVDKFEHIIETDSIKLVTYCVNPIATLILIIEQLRLLSNTKNNQILKISNLSMKFLELTLLYLKEINELSILTHIFCKPFNKALKNLTFLDIFMQDPMFYKDILSTDFMVNILRSELCAGYQFDYNFLITSTSYHYLANNFSLRHEPNSKIFNINNTIVEGGNPEKRRESFSNYLTKISDPNVFNYIRKPEISDTMLNNHIHSYLIFTRNINFRLFISFIFFTVLMSILYFNIYQASQLSSNVSNIQDDIVNYATYYILPPKYSDVILQNIILLPTSERNSNLLYKKYILNETVVANNKIQITGINTEQLCYEMFVVLSNTPEMNEYVEECNNSLESLVIFSSDLNDFLITVCLVLVISSEIFVARIYVHLKKQSPTYVSAQSAVYEISFIISIALICLLVRIQFKLNAFTIADWIFEISATNLLLNCQLLTLLLIFFFYLSYVEQLGRLVKMVVLVFKELSRYLIVLAFNTLYMALAFYVLFSEDFEEFHLFFNCVKISVEGFLGSFVYIETEEDVAGIAYFVIFSIYLLICNAVFLNLIIAVLNNTYNKFHEMGQTFLTLQVYEVNKTHGYNKYYSGMISNPPPFNFISGIAGIFLSIHKSIKLNEFCLKCSYYMFSCLPSCIYFIISNIVIIPLAWISILLKLVSNNYKTFDGFRYNVTGRITLLHMMLWSMFGIFYLYWVLFTNDIPLFLESCFVSVENRSLLKPISKTDWTILKKIVRDFTKNERKSVDYMEFLQSLIEKYTKLDRKNMSPDKIRETVTGLRRITQYNQQKLHESNTENLINTENISPERKTMTMTIINKMNSNTNIMNNNNNCDEYEEKCNSLQIYREKYRAQELFYRFVVNEKIDVVRMSILLQKLKKKKRKKKNQEKTKKSLFLINLIAVSQFEEAVRKLRKAETEEAKILNSFEYE